MSANGGPSGQIVSRGMAGIGATLPSARAPANDCNEAGCRRRGPAPFDYRVTHTKIGDGGAEPSHMQPGSNAPWPRRYSPRHTRADGAGLHLLSFCTRAVPL